MQSFKQFINESKLSDFHILSKQGLSVEKVNAILQLAELLKVDWRKIKDMTNESVSFEEATSDAPYPPSYKKNTQLLTLIKKHDDPFKFILAVISAMSAGKLKLKRIGVANTREIAALWNDMKTKKISPSLIDHVMLVKSIINEGIGEV